jgi:hypothetical protein
MRVSAVNQKELYEQLDHLVEMLEDDGCRQEFREVLFKLSSNAITETAIDTRDLVRRWLRTNDPTGAYR